VNEAARQRARRTISIIARRMLAGRVSYLDGARALLRLRAKAGLEDDPTFTAFVLIESETDHLPIGQQRKYWSNAALVAKESEIRRAEEWAVRTAELETRRLATRFHAQTPTTLEILARRMLERESGQECVDWAIAMLEVGYESRSLLVLAGLTPPFNHFEVSSFRDRALQEIRPPELGIEDPVNAHVAEIVFEAIYDAGTLRDVFARVANLAIELGYPLDLQPFFNLHFAAQDLLHSDMQWYWPGATNDNIEEIMVQEARRFVARYAG
jgi:hypothetical protein